MIRVRKPAAEAKEAAVSVQELGSLEVRSLVYRPSEFPLSSFFKRLAKGEFKDAFAKMDLSYEPSNADGEAMQTLLDNGFVPTLISVTNTGKEPESLEDLQLMLKSPHQLLEPVANDKLPRAFEEINWSAVAANTYNAGLVIPMVFVVQVAYWSTGLATAGMSGEGPGYPTLERLREAHGVGEVFNPAHATIDVDYMHLLYWPETLGPGKSTVGLLFFELESGVVDWSELRMEARLK